MIGHALGLQTKVHKADKEALGVLNSRQILKGNQIALA